ncbi:MAG: carboxypeptidase-like regulatory domain-containing protein, partial [Bacteroidota bacterium]
MRITSFFIMLPFITHTAQLQQTTRIEGMVSNALGQALPYTNVFISDLGIGSVGDANGYFRLEKVPMGTHIVTVTSLGFKTASRTIKVGKDAIKGLNFRLEEETKDLEEVVVEGKSDASKLQESAQAVTVVTTETLKLQTADLGEIMAKTEGVSVQRGG